MPWENIGDVNTGDLPGDREWIEFSQKLAIQYLLFVCGKPPHGTSLEIMSHDHELGPYTSIGLWYEFEAPWEYLHKCEDALDILNESINWSDLHDHYEDSLADVDVDAESEFADGSEEYQNDESAAESPDEPVPVPNTTSLDDDFPIDEFASVGAMMLIEAIAGEADYPPEDFYAQMKAEWGEVIDPHWDKIFTQSLKRRNEWLNEQRKERTNDDFHYEYCWELSDRDLAEIAGEESPDDAENEEIENQLRGVQKALAEVEERRINAVQEIRDIHQRIAREFERVANGEGLVDSIRPNPTERHAPVERRSDVDALGFYSQAYRAIESKMPNKASAEQVRSILSSENCIKKEELEWLDIDYFLQKNPNPSRDHVLDYIKVHNVRLEEVQLGADENSPARFQDRPFHLPGGENYREFVLTMPGQIEPYEPDQIHFTAEGDGTAVVWARFDDRDSGQTLHIAEIQSKRHQDGRERGYRNKDGSMPLFADVPYAPYKNANAWSMLMFKRMLRHAVATGYERITWDTGNTQAERYGLDEAAKRGMEAFYDVQLVNNVNSFVRRWDARVEKANSENGRSIYAGSKGQVPVHSVEITSKMRGQVLDEGTPLFSVLSSD